LDTPSYVEVVLKGDIMLNNPHNIFNADKYRIQLINNRNTKREPKMCTLLQLVKEGVNVTATAFWSAGRQSHLPVLILKIVNKKQEFGGCPPHEP
jgi:hypothetical protein